MEQLQQAICHLEAENEIRLEDIPEIDLYIDQVIQLFEKKLSGTKRYENDKILTKAMINNYAKGKLFFPIENKKYTRNHIMLISLIYGLKGQLAINDIKQSLQELNEMIVKDEQFNLEDFYEIYLHFSHKNAEKFKEEFSRITGEATDKIREWKNGENDYLIQLLLIASLVHMGNLYKRTAEKLVDLIIEEKGKQG